MRSFNWLRLLAVLVIVLLAGGLRIRAALLLPTDYDEDDYLRAGQLYAQHLARRDLAGIRDERENYEHPPQTKLVYGAILLAQGPQSYQTPVKALTGDRNGAGRIAKDVRNLRFFNAGVGALTAGAVALVNPLAGLLVAINSWHIKYTSQAMLEALPALWSALALLCLRRTAWQAPFNPRSRALWLAAMLLGLAAAGKYLYGVAGLGTVAWLVWRGGGRRPRTWAVVAGWGAVALLTFYAADPALWPDPVGRLMRSLAFSTSYAAGKDVQKAAFGWAQPVVWLVSACPWHPGVFPLLFDGIFGIAGVLVLRRLWREGAAHWRLVIAWFGVTFVFLLFWPTKWPQYILGVTVPISLLGSEALQRWARRAVASWRTLRRADATVRREQRQALGWLLPFLGLFAFAIAYPLLLQLGLAATDYRVGNIRNGIMPVWNTMLRGVLGLSTQGSPSPLGTALPYYGPAQVGMVLGNGDIIASLRFNILWVMLTMALATVLGLGLALLLNQKGLRGKGAWRLLFILPWAIPEFVGALIWSTLFNDTYGGINFLLGEKIRWLTDRAPLVNVTKAAAPFAERLDGWQLTPISGLLRFAAAGLSTPKAFWVVVFVSVWITFPFMLVVSLAALRTIPRALYDAARVDGATRWQQWRFVTWPLLRPFIWPGVLLRSILLFNAFHIPWMLGIDTQATGTAPLAMFGYTVMRYNSAYSFAAVINTVVLVIGSLLIWLFNRRTQVAAGVSYQ